jgi:nicotinamide-nucleotide amidase
MRIGMLIIGTELLQGKITDANTVWMAQYLRPWNLRLHMTLTVPDDHDAIQAALTMLSQHCDGVICSGGLGPTADDITKTSIGVFFGKTLGANTQARSIAEKNYARFERILAPDHGYGYLPADFEALNNPSGFAPGLWYEEKQCCLLAAPGVPKEFRDMISEAFPLKLAPKILTTQKLRLLNFRTRGVPEEKIFQELAPGLWERLAAFGNVSSLPHVLGVDIGVTVEDKHVDAIQNIVHQSPLAPHVWHEGFESLEELIVQKASALGITFGFAESCTGGLCSHRMTNVAGSSQVFWGSVVSYDNSIKVNLLHVKETTLAKYGAVSEATACEMAKGAQQALKTTLAISLTGIAGPGGGSTEKPVGTVWVGIATESGVGAKKFEFRGDRETLKLRFSQIALYTLLDHLKI